MSVENIHLIEGKFCNLFVALCVGNYHSVMSAHFDMMTNSRIFMNFHIGRYE